MGYRDQFQAAIARADALEQELAQSLASNAANARATDALREELAICRSEIGRLRSLLPDDLASGRFAPVRYALVAGAALVPATALAGSLRETFGVAMSYLAVAPFAFALGAKIGERRSHRAGYVVGVIAVPLGLLLLSVFYSSIWPSL